MDSEQRQHLEELLGTYRRRLRLLEKQAAEFGSRIDPQIRIEIEDIRAEIARIEGQLGINETPNYTPNLLTTSASTKTSGMVADETVDPRIVTLRSIAIDTIERKKQEIEQLRPFDFGDSQKDSEVSSLVSGTKGFLRYYQNGLVVWHGTGEHSRQAFAIYGGIGSRFRGMKEDAWSKVGFPVADEFDTDPSPFGSLGRCSRFENGIMIWYSNGSYREQTYAVHGAIAKEYIAMGGTGSHLGFPISEPYSIDGGERCDFEGGSIVLLSSNRDPQIIRQLLRINYSDSPFNHEWRQYSGSTDLDCIAVRHEIAIGKNNSFVAFNTPWPNKAIEYPADKFKVGEITERYCAITVKSLGRGGWFRFYLNVATNTQANYYLDFDSARRDQKREVDRKEKVEYFKLTLPDYCNNGDWHTFIVDQRDKTREGFLKSFLYLRRFCFRGHLGIADLVVSNSLEALERVVLNPVNL